MSDVHERRREKDRLAQARARARAKESGEPMGHALDALLCEGLALTLAGRDRDDPVRVAIQKGISKAFAARRVGASKAVGRRLQARLSISTSLRTALDERRLEGIEGGTA
jgi:hypothetical protein